MANRINASNLSDLLLPMRQRGNAPGVYFVRLCQWSPEIKDFLWRYHEAARAKGVIIEGQIGNPFTGASGQCFDCSDISP